MRNTMIWLLIGVCVFIGGFSAGCTTIRSTGGVLRALGSDVENITDAAVQGRGAYDARYNALYNAPRIVDSYDR
jgi:hypothetical protein